MNRRILTAMFTGAVLAACTTTPATSATTAAVMPAHTVGAAARVITVQPRPVAGIGLTAAVSPIVTNSRHAAFPGVGQAPDGSLVMVWRGGYDHEARRDGLIYRATSRDQGKSWSGEQKVPVSVPGNHDYRDPNIAFIDGHEYLSFFVGSTTNGAEGAYVSRDGGTPVRVDGGLPYAAMSAPVVKLPDGRLATAFYGRKAGESLWTAWMAWSSDLGASWSTNRIVNSGIDTAEPWLVVDGANVHMFSRFGGDRISVRTSTNSGNPGSWGDVRVVVTDCTGRPTALATRAGTLVMVCRGPLSRGNHAQAVYALNHTTDFRVGPTVMAAPANSIGMTYVAMVEIMPGIISIVVGMQQVDGSSGLYSGYLTESVN